MRERASARRRAGQAMAVGVLLYASVLRAAGSDCTFYVRAGFVPAGGSPDGRSPDAAFSTINDGAAAIKNPGDVVCVGPGLYVEGNVGVRADGAGDSPDGGNAHPVEIRADPTGESTGDPPGPVRMIPPTDTPDANLITTAFLILGRHDVLIDGFEISGFSDAGIQVRPSAKGDNCYNVTIRNNTVTGCGKGIDVIAQGKTVIESNRAAGNTTSGISAEMCLTASEAGRCRGASGVPVIPTISNNRSGGNGADGIFVQAADNAVVQNNIVYSNGHTGVALRECNDALIVNNLVYANGESSLAVGKADLASPGVVVLNNTFYANTVWAIDIGSPGAGSPGGAVVNNIIWRNGDGHMGVGVLNENSGLMPVRPASVCGYVEGFNFVLDEYGPDTPYNTYDIHTDPFLADPGGPDGVLGGEMTGSGFVDYSADDDFHLRQLSNQGEVSPAVDAGSATVAALGLTGSTASDGSPDRGVVDVGFHYGADAAQVITFNPPFMPLYVRTSGDDSGDGLTPATAFAKIAMAAQRSRGGVTVVVGPGRYPECKMFAPPNGGKVTFLADPTGGRTLDAPGAVLVDAGQCLDEATGMPTTGETGFDMSSECDVVIDGFHVTGATEDAIRVDDHSDGAILRNNVTFANGTRGIHVVNSDDVQVLNNLVYDNPGGIVAGGACSHNEDCTTTGSRGVVIEFNTAFKSDFDGIQVGDGIGVSSGGTVRYNVTGQNGKNGIEVGDDTTRTANLMGYTSAYNLIGDKYAVGVPRGLGDLIVDLSIEPLYVDPSAIDVSGDWLADQHFRLVQTAAGQTAQSRAVDYADVTALEAGLADRSTRTDGAADVGFADLGYHYPRLDDPLVGDCNGDGRVTVDELVLAVRIATDDLAMSACPAIDADGDGRAEIDELVRAVNNLLA
jgi:parallel beta-helix repeat protein